MSEASGDPRRTVGGSVRPLSALLMIVVAVVGWVLASSVGASGAVGVEHARSTSTTVVTTTVAPETSAAGSGDASDADTPSSVDAPLSTVASSTTLPSTTVPALEQRVTESDRATTRLNLVVVALLVLAVIIAAATVVFWVRTRPDRSGPGRPGVVDPDTTATTTTAHEAIPVAPVVGTDSSDAGDTTSASADPDDPWTVAPAPELVRPEPVDPSAGGGGLTSTPTEADAEVAYWSSQAPVGAPGAERES